MPDVSIAVSVRDNFSDAITTMRNANQSFNKDLTGTMEKLDKLNETKYQLKVDTDKAKEALKEAEKQYNATGDAADKMARDMAAADYDKAKRNLNLVSSNAKQAEKDILNMTDAVEKADNRASRISSGGKDSGTSGMFSRLAGAGLTKMFGDSLTGVAQAYIGSAFSDETGTAVSNVLGGITSGAAMGSIGGLPGAAIGAAVGAASGAIEAATKTFANKDNAFKSAVQENYNSVTQNTETTLQNGSSIAGSREQTQMAFAQRLGSDKAAEEYLDKTKTMAKETNYTFDEITGYSKKLLNSYKPDQVFGVLQKLSDASAGLNLSSSDVDMFISGLSRMRTTGKATQEYLNYFSERGIDVYQALSNSTGAKKSQIAGMVTKGKISGDTAAQAILDYINETFGGLSQKLSTTYDAMKDNLQDAQDDINASMGEGYNTERKKGIQAQMDWLGGSNGTKMSDAYSMIGSWKASLENAEEKAVREAMDKAMGSEAYKDANSKNDRAKMGEILAQAQVDGENNYRKTEGYKLEVESEKSLVSSIRDSMKEDGIYKTYGYDMGLEFSKGLASAAQPGIEAATAPKTQSAIAPSKNSTASSFYTGNKTGATSFMPKPSGNATGLNRVPYNNYATLLHEDERVLTGVEARSQKGGSGVQVTITGPVTVRKESDIDEIATMLYQKLRRANAVTP